MTAVRRVPAALIAALLLAACGGDGGELAATPTASRTSTVPPSPSATATPTASASPSATATPTATASPVPSATATATRPPLRLPDLHADPDPVNGGRIVDAEGREVLLRGVNVNALVEYWQYGDLPTVFAFTEDDAALIASIGWNAVRLLLSWSRVEPAPGEYDAAYLEEARAMVRMLAAHGIYAILDLHQDAWGPTLAAPGDEVCDAPDLPAFGWDGAPGWATVDDGARRCAVAGIRELSPAVLNAFAAFFADAPGPGGVGIRSRYVAMLAHVAGTLGAEAGVAGYDLMNEPNAFSSEHVAALTDLYGAAIAAIRAAEAAAGSPPRLVLFEPGAAWALLGFGQTPDFPRDRDVVYAPHLYQGGLDDQDVALGFATARDDARRYGGAPVLTGEWGSDPRRASDPDDPYFIAHQRLQDEHRIGAALWTWRESCGDPHKAGDVRAGRVPYVWGEFEVDCTTNAVSGLRDDLLSQLRRGYVRAAPGRLAETRFDAAAGTLAASGSGAPPGAELLAVFPGTAELVAVTGLRDVRLRAGGDGGVSHIVASATGGDWTLSLRAPQAQRAR